jgi:hypothetical protein
MKLAVVLSNFTMKATVPPIVSVTEAILQNDHAAARNDHGLCHACVQSDRGCHGAVRESQSAPNPLRISRGIL